MGQIEDILNDFQGKFGIKGIEKPKADVIPTGFESIDKALGIGGVPKRKTTEISGEPGVGKSALAYHIIAEAQKQHLIVMYVNAETMSMEFAKKCGVDPALMLIMQPLTGEVAIQLIAYYLERKMLDVVVIDSIPALLSKFEKMNNINNHPLQRRMIATLFKNLMAMVDRTDVTVIALNQFRQDKTNKVRLPFNKIMNYFASVRIQLFKGNDIKKNRKKLGHEVETHIIKNNFGERTSTTFQLMK